MELAEPIERINQQLQDYFGIDTASSRPMWRVVWSQDQREKRETMWSEDGSIALPYPVIMELPKYQHIKEKYILERLVLVPGHQQKELAGEKTSYECMWSFEDNKGQYLPPRFDMCKFVIDNIYAAEGKKSMRHYIDDPDLRENKEKRLAEYQEYLFGNETDVTDALARREGVVVPSKIFTGD